MEAAESSGTPARVPPKRSAKWALGAALLALTAIVAAGAWLYLARTSPELASPSHVEWFDLRGEAIADGSHLFESCAADFGFDSLSFDEALWGSCTMNMSSSTGLVRIDATRGRGQYYPVPEQLAYAGTYGLIPNEDGRLGVVYAARGIGEALAVGVVDRNGWVISPRIVSEERYERYSGGAWVDGELEIVLVDLEAGAVVRVLDSTFQRRALELGCGEANACRLSQVALRRENGWRILGSTTTELFEFDETAQRNESPWVVDGPSIRAIPENIDNVSNGVVQAGNLVSLREEGNLGTLQRDGSLAPLVPLPIQWTSALVSRLVFEDGTLTRAPVALVGSALAQRMRDRWVAVEADWLTVVRLDFEMDGQLRDQRQAGDLHNSECSRLTSGTVVENQGSLWLVHPSGCYLSLGDDDARQPTEH